MAQVCACAWRDWAPIELRRGKLNMKKRRYGVVLLVLCLLVGLLAGCGKKDDDDDKKKDDVASVKKGTIAEMVEAMAEVKQGTFSVQYTTKLGEAERTYVLDLAYNLDKNEYALSVDVTLKQDAQIQRTELGELVRVVDNKLYVNLGALKSFGLKRADGSDFTGWFMFPLPKDMKIADRKDGYAAALGKLAGKLIAGDAVTGSEGNYTLTLKGRDAWSSFLTNVRTYADGDMKDDLKAVTDKVGTQGLNIDLEKYIDDLMEEFEDDLRAVLKQYGGQVGVKEEDLDTYAAKLKELVRDVNLEELVNSYTSDLTTFNDLSDAEEAIKELKEELDNFEENLGEAPDVTVGISADDKGYNIVFNESYKSLYDSDAEALIKFRIEPGTVKTAAPSADDKVSLQDIAALLAPSLSRYLDKAGASKDAASLLDAIYGADKVAIDPQLDLPIGTNFVITFDNGVVTMTVVRPDGASTAEAENTWKEISSFKGVSSANGKAAVGKIVGTLENEGDYSYGLVWRKESSNTALNDLMNTGSLKYSVNWADE